MFQCPRPVVLIAEDEDLIRMLAVVAFDEAGFIVLEAADAAQALAVHAAAERIELLFTDVNMPGELNGIDLAERLKGSAPGLHIIVASALPIQRPLDHLGATFFEKPYNVSDVCRAAMDLIAA